MRDLGLIPGLGRSPGEEKGYPLQYAGVENYLDCIVHGVTESDVTSLHFTGRKQQKEGGDSVTAWVTAFSFK